MQFKFYVIREEDDQEHLIYHEMFGADFSPPELSYINIETVIRRLIEMLAKDHLVQFEQEKSCKIPIQDFLVSIGKWLYHWHQTYNNSAFYHCMPPLLNMCIMGYGMGANYVLVQELTE